MELTAKFDRSLQRSALALRHGGVEGHQAGVRPSALGDHDLFAGADTLEEAGQVGPGFMDVDDAMAAWVD